MMPIYRIPISAPAPAVVAAGPRTGAGGTGSIGSGSGSVGSGTVRQPDDQPSSGQQQRQTTTQQRQVDLTKPASVQSGGMSIVDQEIQRQRERETQLRAERELLATASLLSPSSSPAVSPMAGTGDRRPPTKVADAERLSKRRTFDGESSLVHEMDEQRQREEELRQQRTTTRSTTGASVNGLHPESRAPAGHVVRRTTPSVRPLAAGPDGDDDDETDNNASFITPRNDTLIEREIRITRQREGSLRRVRGYPVINQQTAVEVPLSGFARRLQGAPAFSPSTSPRTEDPPGGSSGVGDNVAMKRMATNRLRLEILRERKREVDLRNQGKIYTISEEHIERPPLLAELVQTSTSPRTARTNDVVEHRDDVVVANSDASHPASTATSQRQQQQPRVQHHDETRARRRLVGEKLIEQEVRELRLREQELRDQRRQAVSDDVRHAQTSVTSAKPATKSTYRRHV